MAKTIILTEEQNKIIMEQMLHEAQGDVIIGRDRYNSFDLNKLQNLPSNMYTLSKPQEDFDRWELTNFDKESQEYAKWCSDVEYFMKGIMGGMVASIENKKTRGAVTFNLLILDPQWMRLAIQGSDKLAELGQNEGRNTGFRCLYTFVLTIYQNKCMWNDFFFNPVFKDLPAFMSQLVKEAIGKGPEYKQIMPLKQIKEMNMFKANQDNANPDLFYDPNWKNMGYTKAEEDSKRQYLIDHPVLTADDYD